MTNRSREVAAALTIATALLCACDSEGDLDGGMDGVDGSMDRDAAGADASVDGDAGRRTDAGPDAGPVEPGVPREGLACTTAGWCWETPLPLGGTVTGLHVLAPGQVVAASPSWMVHVDDGVVRHAARSSPAFANAFPVWGTGPDDVWAGAPEALLHFDGARWTEFATSTRFVSSISGVASDDAWAVDSRVIERWDGTGWTAVDTSAYATATFSDVWAVGPGEAIVGGRTSAFETLVLHVRADGSIDDLGLAQPTRTARAVYASAPDDVWVAADTEIHHLSGGTWSEVALPSPSIVSHASAMWGNAPDDLWIVAGRRVFHWDGASFAEERIDSVSRGSAPSIGAVGSDVWIADGDGQLLRRDGDGWAVAHKETLAPTDFDGVAVGDDGVGWAFGRWFGLAQRHLDGRWTWESLPGDELPIGVAVAASETFLFTEGPGFRRAGDTWSEVASGLGLRDACATDAGVILGVGDRLSRFTAGAWVDLAPALPSPYTHIECVGDEAWARLDDAGNRPLHWDGEAWAHWGFAELDTFDAALAPDPEQAWVLARSAGSEGVVLRWNGRAFRGAPGLPTTLRGFGATGPDDVWLVGDAGVVRRWTGAGFETHDVPGAPDLRWVGPGAPGSIVAVDAAGEVWERAGGSWSARGVSLSAVSSAALVDAAFAGGTAYAVGDAGEALILEAGGWTVLAGADAQSVAASDDAGVWFAGLDGVARIEAGALSIVDAGLLGVRVEVPFTGSTVFAYGAGGLHRSTGGAFTADPGPFSSGTVAVFGHGPGAMWAIASGGAGGGAQTWRGADPWIEAPAPRSPVGFGYDSASGARLIVDIDAAVYRRQDDGYDRIVDPEPLLEPLLGAQARDADEVWAQFRGGILHADASGWGELVEPLGIVVNAWWSTPGGALYAAGDGASVVSLQP